MRRLIRLNVIKSFIIKEFRQILRDKKMKMVLFGSPVLMLLVFGYAANTDVVSIKMAVRDDCKNYESRRLIERFTSNGYFLYVADIDSHKDASLLLDQGDVDMVLHIPYNFSTFLKKGTTAQIQILVDGSDSARASVILSYVNAITLDYSAEFFKRNLRRLAYSMGSTYLRSGAIVVEERTLFNPELLSRNFFLPGVLGLLIALITIMMTSMAVVKERESGTIEQIIVSPVTPLEFVFGKTIPFAIIGFLDIIIISLIAIFWFKVPFNGNFVLLLFCGLLYILCTLSVGLYISTISQTQQQAMLSTFLFFIPSIMLSGFIFPIYAMPLFFRIITLVNPMRYFMSAIRGIFLKGIGISFLWQSIIGRLVLSCFLFFLSAIRVSRRFE